MSKYSSDSDENDYRTKISRRRRYRSDSSSSRDSYKLKRSNRSRKSRSRSSDRNISHHSVKSRNNSRRSRSSSYKNQSRSRKLYKSNSRSRSRSRTSSVSFGKSKSYSKSKRKYKSRSRSRSYNRRSRSRSRRRSRSRQKSNRSRSRSYKKHEYSPESKNNSFSNSTNNSLVDGKKSLPIASDTRSGNPTITSFNNNQINVTIASDDPLIKQEELDYINTLSFAPKIFKSAKSNLNQETKQIFQNQSDADKFDGDISKRNNFDNAFLVNEKSDLVVEKKTNNTVFHDNIVFEDNEIKIQKWVKKLYTTRQKFLFGFPKRDGVYK